jgi:hypothetical protein
MTLERAVAGSTVVGFAWRLHDRFASWIEPVTRPLAAVDRRFVRVARGSRLHAWLTADSEPDPIVIDLRKTYTVGALLAVLDWVATAVDGSRATDARRALGDRVASAPARAFGVVCTLAFTLSLLASVAEGSLTTPVYLFHGLGLVVGLVAFREQRDGDALAESPVWGALLAVFAPPPKSIERED